MEQEKYLDTYTADNAAHFWTCGVKDCRIPYPHQVGMTQDHQWEHVFAKFYSEVEREDSVCPTRAHFG